MKRWKIFNKTAIFLLPILLIGAFFVIFFTEKIKEAFGGATDNVRGYAWSENIGWISFNCTNDSSCATSNYGVKLDPSVMNFSGYAWSDGVGWISFGTSSDPTPDANGFRTHCQDGGANCISSNDCIACYNPDDGKVYGWAHIISMGDEGWIKLNCANDSSCGASNYGIYLNRADFRGWAYNGNDMESGIGWISFNCLEDGSCATSTYKVYLNNVNFPEAFNLEAPNWDDSYACDNGARGAFLSWDFYDADSGDSQGSYQVIVNSANSTSSPLINSGRVYSNTEQYYISSGSLNYNTPYYWWVRVWDQYGFASNWTQFDTTINTASSTHVLTDNAAGNLSANPDDFELTFTTYLHEFPSVDYYYIPTELMSGEVATFTASSTYSTTGSPSSSFACDDVNCDFYWTGTGVNSMSSSSEIITEIIFEYSLDPSVSTTSVSLSITDGDNYTCSTTKHMFADLLPNWKEIKPE